MTRATEILCRLDAAKAMPIIFFPATIDKGMLMAWGDGTEMVTTLAHYHTTLPLSSSDEKVLRGRYVAAIGDDSVVIRHRLPRTIRQRPNLLTADAPQMPMPSAAPIVLAQPEPIASIHAEAAEQSVANVVSVEIAPVTQDVVQEPAPTMPPEPVQVAALEIVAPLVASPADVTPPVVPAKRKHIATKKAAKKRTTNSSGVKTAPAPLDQEAVLNAIRAIGENFNRQVAELLRAVNTK